MPRLPIEITQPLAAVSARAVRMGRMFGTILALGLAGVPAAAEGPRVVADIAPVQALVATVMEGVGTPELLVPASASAHDLALKPSQARALMRADLVVWLGPEMAPWLGRALEAAERPSLQLLRWPGTQLYGFREASLFGDEVHESHVEEGHEEHGGHGGHEGHDHDGVDPHAWLDPLNAALWLEALAVALAELDPEHGDLYRANAARGVAQLETLTAELDALLAPARGVGLIAFHDAFQYFEARFGLSMVGAITPADDSDPGPARISALRDAARSGQVVCAFAEPQFNPGLLEAVVEEAGLPIAILDPLGADQDLGPGLYEAMLKQMGAAVAACVARAEAG